MEKYWLRIIKLGKTKFILLHALLFGLGIFLFGTLFRMLVDSNFSLSRFYSPEALGMLTGGLIGGLIFGVFMWYVHKNKTN